MVVHGGRMVLVKTVLLQATKATETHQATKIASSLGSSLEWLHQRTHLPHAVNRLVVARLHGHAHSVRLDVT